jgi:hypothetical protein
MSKYPGRIISATPPTVSLSEASGVWTLEEAAQYQEAGTWPVAVPGIVADPNFNQTVLLLHGDGTNGAQNNTFLDGSTNNFTITRNGNTTQGTFSPFSLGAGEWSNYFGGSGNYLSAAYNAAWDFSTGDFSIECFAYVDDAGRSNDASKYGTMVSHGVASSLTNQWGFTFLISGGVITNVLLDVGSGTALDASGLSISRNAWHHFLVCRTGTTLSIFVDGTRVGTTTYSSSIAANSSGTLQIARFAYGGAFENWVKGYISNVRIIKGSQPYNAANSTITQPTTPLTNITNTSLLTCQSNRFVDNSTNAFAITRNGDVKVTPFSPFAPTAAYSASTNGGSGYFDGTGDYLRIADNAAFTLGSGNFTIECWLYSTKTGARQGFSGQSDSSGNVTTISYYIEKTSGNKLRAVVGVGGVEYAASSSADIPLNQWSHVAFVRNGNTGTLYINGTADGTVDLTGVTANNSSNQVGIGSIGEVTTLLWEGQISNFRMVVGTAVYTAAFTPPTAPLAAITNTQLLLNFTNAGIFDNTGKNNLETVGDAQIDTTTKKYGTGSMEFDGTTDYLFIPNDVNKTLGTGDYTIEFWVYANNWTSTPVLLEYGRATSGNTPGLEFYISNTSGKLDIYGGSTTGTLLVSAGTNISTGSWTHVALTRASGSTKLFLNGTQTGSTATDTTNYTQATIFIGAYFAGGLCLNGFIDDLRITKGVARYTANFTPPTAAFPDE